MKIDSTDSLQINFPSLIQRSADIQSDCSSLLIYWRPNRREKACSCSITYADYLNKSKTHQSRSIHCESIGCRQLHRNQPSSVFEKDHFQSASDLVRSIYNSILYSLPFRKSDHQLVQRSHTVPMFVYNGEVTSLATLIEEEESILIVQQSTQP